MAEKDKKNPTGVVSRGTKDVTGATSDVTGGAQVRQGRRVSSVTINVSPASTAHDTFPYGPGVARPRHNPYDSIGNASRAASARFEQRGEEMRQRAKDKETMSPHDYAMKHNPKFRAMFNQVQEYAAQEQKRQNDINSGKVTDLDKFNKTNWQAAGERDQGKTLDLANGDVARRIDAVEDWQKNQWQTSYDAKTGKSFNRFIDNFDTSRVGGALRTNADGTQSFDFKNMTESQLKMLESVMQKDQAATRAATHDMNIAKAKNKQKAVREATTRLMDRGVRLTFDPKTGTRLQTDDQILALDQAYQKVDAAKAVEDLAAAQKTPAGLNDVETQNKVFRQLIAAGTDPSVARGMVTLGETPNNVDAVDNLHVEGLKGVREGEKGWNNTAQPKNPPQETAIPKNSTPPLVTEEPDVDAGIASTVGYEPKITMVGDVGSTSEADKLYAKPKMKEFQPPTVANPMGNAGDLTAVEYQKKPGLKTILD